jgi:hypothetical protein
MTGRGVHAGARNGVERALGSAMSSRLSRLNDDHHPAYLHPGRSVLILLHDVQELPSSSLPIAAAHESEDAPLRLSAARLRAELGEEVAAAVARLPLPGDEALEERLVMLERDLALAVLAERLDHLRHLHLRKDLSDEWEARHAEVERAWAPFAARTDPRLVVRFDHWARTFGRRLRRP